MFFTHGHKLLSLIPSLPQLLFSVMPIFASCRLFYVCVSEIFANPKTDGMHISYMYKRCKLFVLFDLYRNRLLNFFVCLYYMCVFIMFCACVFILFAECDFEKV